MPAPDALSGPSAAIVIVAGGSGTRMGATAHGQPINKVLLPLAGTPVVAHCVKTALTVPGVTRIVVVAREDDQQAMVEAIQPTLGGREVVMTLGGATRHDSEWSGLAPLLDDIASGFIDVVAIHDAARPLATAALFTSVIEAARSHGGAIPVVALRDAVRRDGAPVPADVAAVQTPQAFQAAPLVAAYSRADQSGFRGTDTAACLAEFEPHLKVAAVEGSPRNLKVTFAGDLEQAAALLP